jgi:hypothetical protein
MVPWPGQDGQPPPQSSFFLIPPSKHHHQLLIQEMQPAFAAVSNDLLI